ncbi:serine/threonine protein kinase [Kitasatospora herbaricolor]|uniref:serine/threonine-protein kinase n=1 Tax=Kitasatospora herbaricolor TaxID=68217 RepID=UPI002E3420E2|nr:serine/threonine-protein kinase [Kitasatospora herbaricolor]
MSGGGTVLGGRYRLVERIGGGGMGSVWRAEDEVLGRQVAVKVLHRALFEEGTFAARFKREAQLLAALRHPGIVDVHDYGEGEEESGERAAFIVMELVEGRPLNEVLADGGVMGAERALGLLATALDALEAAHRRGIVHRDLKPSNLMLRGDDQLTVTDFGIARALASSRITASHTVLGTALYMAPEQAEGAATTPASDLYSIGVVCYELLTGEPPFLGESVLEVALKHIRDPAPELPSDIPPAVRELVAKALAKRPEDRFADAAAMAAAARAALTDGAAAAAPTVRVLPAPAPVPAPATQPALPVVDDGPVADEVPVAKDAPVAEAGDAAASGKAAPAPETPGKDEPGKDGTGDHGTGKDRTEKDAPGEAGARAATERSTRRSRRRLLVPFIVPVIITAGTGTVLLIDRPSYRADAEAPGPQQSAPASGGSAGPAGTASAAGAPAPTPVDAAAQATAVPSAPGAGPAAPGAGTQPGSQQSNAAGTAAGGSAADGAAAGGAGGQGTTPRGGAPTPAAGASAPPAPATQPAPAPTTVAPAPAVPQGCGGTNWGAIVNVGDNLKIGLAKDGPAGGTPAVMGGYTAYGWVHSVPSSWHHFNPCNMNAPEFVQTTDGRAALSDGFSFLANWKVDPATTSGAVLLKDYMGSKCLTDNGAGNQLTMATCTPGNKAQEWRIP